MESLPILYDVCIERHGHDGHQLSVEKREKITVSAHCEDCDELVFVRVDWGNSPSWMEKYNEILDKADSLSLMPKVGVSHLPSVVVQVGGARKWILYSRVYGQVTSSRVVRMYVIGWKERVSKERSIKSTLWIYPNGAVEHAEIPTFWKKFL